jgi:hypothetical protein
MAAFQVGKQRLFLLFANRFVFSLMGETSLLHLLEQAIDRRAYRVCQLFNRYFSHQSLLPPTTSWVGVFYI